MIFSAKQTRDQMLVRPYQAVTRGRLLLLSLFLSCFDIKEYQPQKEL